MKSVLRLFSFSALSFLVVLNVSKAEVKCDSDGKSYGAKLVACNWTKSSCDNSEIFETPGGAVSCIPNKQIIAVYAANTGCTELPNVTGTKKVCIDWIDPATGNNKQEVCYDYNDCIASPLWIGWECLALTQVKEGKVDVKCTADCVVVLDD